MIVENRFLLRFLNLYRTMSKFTLSKANENRIYNISKKIIIII